MIPHRPKVSYWQISPQLQRLCRRKLTGAWRWAEPQLQRMGERAATEVADLAALADRESPKLVTFDERGNRVNRVEFHPAYREMERIAYGSGMLSMKYAAHEHSADAPFLSFALGYLFAMAEMGLYCPLCMADGVARVVTRFGNAEQIARVVPHLASDDMDQLWTGGMFLTERAGGSDVGANETIARGAADGTCLLTGQKWFCSNVNADAVLATARPEGGEPGIRGIRTYLMITRDNPGVTIDRLKDKLGVRSMATGEVTLSDAPAEEIGDFHAIAEMMNLSRLYNSVAAVAVVGRAIHEARWYIERRQAFGKRVVEHPLAQETLEDLEAEHLAALLITFEAVDALRRADQGDEQAAHLLRILIPVVKATTGKFAVPCVSEAMELIGGNAYVEDWPVARLLRDAQVLPIWEGTTNILIPVVKATTGKFAVPCVSEAMELIGGNAYVEDWPVARLLRDAQVLPIWEGTTNILVLDMLRAAHKERSHELMLERIRASFPAEADALAVSFASLDERHARAWMDGLARAYQLTLLNEIGEIAAVDRLRKRPLGLLPGAKV